MSHYGTWCSKTLYDFYLISRLGKLLGSLWTLVNVGAPRALTSLEVEVCELWELQCLLTALVSSVVNWVHARPLPFWIARVSDTSVVLWYVKKPSQSPLRDVVSLRKKSLGLPWNAVNTHGLCTRLKLLRITQQSSLYLSMSQHSIILLQHTVLDGLQLVVGHEEMIFLSGELGMSLFKCILGFISVNTSEVFNFTCYFSRRSSASGCPDLLMEWDGIPFILGCPHGQHAALSQQKLCYHYGQC